MRINLRRMIWVAVPVVIGLLLASTPARAGELDSTVETSLDKLLAAVQANDYDSFVAEGTPEFMAAITKQMLSGVSAQVASRMKQGYEMKYLGELKQQGCHGYLWKMVYQDGGDDTLVKLFLKDGKVAGFWLQ